MQNVGGRPRARLLNAMIEFLLFPLRKLLGLVQRQAGLHGKVGVRQIQRAFQVDDFGHNLASNENCPFNSGVPAWALETRPSKTRARVRRGGRPAKKMEGLAKAVVFSGPLPVPLVWKPASAR